MKKSSTTEYLDLISKHVPHIFSEESLKSIKLPKKQATKNALDLIRDIDLHEQTTNKNKLYHGDLEEELDEIMN